MARLSDDQWAEVRASYEVKEISDHELSRRFGVSNTAIRKRAVKEGWIKCGSSQLIDMNFKAIKDIKNISSQSSHLSSQHLTAISDEVKFRIANDADLQAIQDKLNLMVANIDNPAHALALMTATVKHREARLGKQPDTAVQINNVMSNNIPAGATQAEIDAIARRLDAEV